MRTPRAVLAHKAARYRREPELRRTIKARTRKYRFVARMLDWWKANVLVPTGPV